MALLTRWDEISSIHAGGRECSIGLIGFIQLARQPYHWVWHAKQYRVDSLIIFCSMAVVLLPVQIVIKQCFHTFWNSWKSKTLLMHARNKRDSTNKWHNWLRLEAVSCPWVSFMRPIVSHPQTPWSNVPPLVAQMFLETGFLWKIDQVINSLSLTSRGSIGLHSERDIVDPILMKMNDSKKHFLTGEPNPALSLERLPID